MKVQNKILFLLILILLGCDNNSTREKDFFARSRIKTFNQWFPDAWYDYCPIHGIGTEKEWRLTGIIGDDVEIHLTVLGEANGACNDYAYSVARIINIVDYGGGASGEVVSLGSFTGCEWDNLFKTKEDFVKHFNIPNIEPSDKMKKYVSVEYKKIP
ncbi:MAG: hypothetical protein ACK40T_09380 [Akkermansiaceae bacterium]|jgi:hypothetical protein